ncbi:MAG: hypothetical protein HFJ49_05080 [Clostridia bacterium]|nr:hypothetical protein [Clostridia bacterium]
MLINIIVAIISFTLGFVIREIIEKFKNKKGYKQVKPLSKQNFKDAMKDLEIK